MAAYLLGQVIVHDYDKFAPYIEQTDALITRYGGEVLDVVRAIEATEGHWPVGALTALVRFPDEDSLRAFLGLTGKRYDESSTVRDRDKQCRAVYFAAVTSVPVTPRLAEAGGPLGGVGNRWTTHSPRQSAAIKRTDQTPRDPTVRRIAYHVDTPPRIDLLVTGSTGHPASRIGDHPTTINTSPIPPVGRSETRRGDSLVTIR